MGKQSAIEWTDSTWNPVLGCSRVSAGCKNCYAFTLHDRRHKAFKEGKNMPSVYALPFNQVQMLEHRLDDPLRWQKPRRIFVNSLSDLFHKDVTDSFIHQVFSVMALARRHTFQVLTKRPQRMLQYLSNPEMEADLKAMFESAPWPGPMPQWEWPLPNVWLGVSVEDQVAADSRIPLLTRTPATKRFLSCEPLLGQIDLQLGGTESVWHRGFYLDWVIVGGESGHGARPMHPDWALGLRDQCNSIGIPFFFKQWGDWQPICQADDPAVLSLLDERRPELCLDLDGSIAISHMGKDDDRLIKQPGYRAWWVARVGKKKAGRLLDGLEWSDFPRESEV